MGQATFAHAANSIEDIRYGENARRTRIVVDVDSPTPYRAFLLSNPNRIVLDLPLEKSKIAKNRFFEDNLLKGYRSGILEPGITRIVFDLKSPALITNIFTLPKSGTARDRVVIDLQHGSQNLFNARLDELYGSKDLHGKTQASVATKAAPVPSHNISADATLPVKKPGQKNVAVANSKIKTVIIDAGHGGSDPGAIGQGGIKEKVITLQMAKELKRQLEETGRYKVYLTRSTDTFIRLRERVNISREKKGDLFISLHADKIDRKDVRGASIYTLSEKASDAETARLADEENRAGIVSGVDLGRESADVADILLDLAMREKMNESNLFARYLRESLSRNKIRLLPNSHRSAGFAVLKAPDIPSVLIEIGFLSNPEEAKLLSSSAFHRNLADALVDGIDAYFRKIEALRKI